MIDNISWRHYVVIILLTLSVVDLLSTFIYVHKYKSWQPDKPYKLMENNPLIVFLWSKFGFYYGSFLSFVIITSLVYLVSKEAHWLVVLMLFGVLCWVQYNHAHNFLLLNKLIAKYPSGHLPEAVFGIVEGNKILK